MSGAASLVNMSYGHLAAAFPVGSPGLPTPPQMNGSPSPPSSNPRPSLSLTTSSSASPLSSPSSSSLLGSGGLLNNATSLGGVGSAAPSGMGGLGSTPAPPHTPHHQQCCENGRPVMTDPHTGQTVCSCQYSSALLSSYSRLPHGLSAPPSSLFGAGGAGGAYSAAAAAAAAGGAQTPYMPLGAEGSAFYSPLGANGSNIRDGSDAWRSLGQPSLYDTSAMGFYPYGTGYGGLDLNARRKNATRESTNTLKAWLQEHIKNPYPTKGEKIMLAIITKMTLTQVSTWFANARRRLKKENKMTWSPRNRSEDGDDDDDDDASDCGDDKKLNNNNSSSSDQNQKDRCRDEHIDVGTESCSKSGEGHRREDKNQGEREVSHCRLSPELPRGPAHIAGEPIQPPPPPSGAGDLLLEGGKPKIWSVSDFLGSAPHKDAIGLSYSPKLDPLKPDLHPGMLGGQASALIGRSSTHAHNGFGSLPGSAHHIPAYPSSLGYSTGAYPYSLSSYGGGKFLSPVATSAAASSRFNPFPPVKPLSMSSPYTSRRDIAMAREGE